MHLEAIAASVCGWEDYDGPFINRYLENIPPGMMKSLRVSVFFPAWLWGPKNHPYLRFVCASHSLEKIGVRDSMKMRRLIMSDWYKERWGDRVKLAGDQNAKTKYETTATGFREAIAADSITGVRGDFVLIDDPHSVTGGLSDAQRETTVEWFLEAVPTRLNNPKKSAIIVIMQRIHESDVSGVILDKELGYEHLCYPADVEVLSRSGWKTFAELVDGEEVMGVDPETLKGRWETPTNYVRYVYNGQLHRWSSDVFDLAVTPDHRMVFKDYNDWQDDRRLNWRVKPASELPKHFYVPQAVDWSGDNLPSIVFGGKEWEPEVFADFMGWYLSEGCSSVKACSTRIVQKVGDNASEITSMLARSPFPTVPKRHCRDDMLVWRIGSKSLAEALEPLGISIDKRMPDMAKNMPPHLLKRLLVVFAKGDGHFAKRNANKITISSRSKRLVDDLQECAVKAGWAASVSYRDDKDGNVFNGYVCPAGRIWKLYIRASKVPGEDRKWYAKIRSANCSVEQYNGEVFCVSVPSTALVVRRNGRVAVSGNCLPMEFDPARKCVTSIGFEDPRTEDGELLFPERFPREVVERDKRVMGPYACNTGEAPVLMADLSLKSIDSVREGDEVLGWVRDHGGRSRMVRTRVKRSFRYVGSVVKMTLDSGEVIRCTPDHKWWRARWEKGRNEYAPANVGTSLARICPPRLPELSPDDLRLAGWLSGFFDGEGSVSVCKKNGCGDYRPSQQIHFYQGAGRNLPLCEKLEHALTHFGFPFKYREDERKPNKDAPCYGYRQYRLVGGQQSLGLAQRFLHIVQPTKWRDRIKNMALGAKFVRDWEKVVSIEPDGVEPVYALETETGNYVVWGIASSNSAGQMQQSPSPRGGGIVKREWWQLYDEEEAAANGGRDGAFPPMDYIVASLDPAYTEKKENDLSALTIWGVWQRSARLAKSISNIAGERVTYDEGTDTVPVVMMMHAWQKRLPIHGPEVVRQPHEDDLSFRRRQQENWGLVEHVTDACKKFKVDVLLIEAKGPGISVGQSIKALHRYENFSVRLIDPGKSDKVARAYAIQPIFSNGQVYAPDRGWSDMVISQFESFPRGAHDDLVDSTTQALRFLRDAGLLRRSVEVAAEAAIELRNYRPNKRPVYEV